MKDILDVNVLDDLNDIVNFNNIRLLDIPKIRDNNTILKIICDKKLKCCLKKIEKISNNSLNFIINFDLETEMDYYELILNKKINKIVNQLNINNYYNIGVKLLIKDSMWLLQSIEISDFETIEEDIVDYHDIREDLLLKLNIRSNFINKNLEKLNLNLNKINQLKNQVEHNFKNSEIDNYYKLIN
jgi:hypothetical protein